MPKIDLKRTRFEVEFFSDESTGGKVLYNELRRLKLVNPFEIPPFKDGKYYVGASLDNAYMLKELFGNWKWEVTEKYRDYVTARFKEEKNFREQSKIINQFKMTDEIEITDYKFKTPPWHHQKIGFSILRKVDSLLLCWDMRTGKTFTVANCLQDAIASGRVKKPLIICPKSIMETVWIKDVYKHTNLTGLAATDNAIKHRIACLARNNISVINNEGDVVTQRGKPQFYVINHDSIRVKSVDGKLVTNDMIDYIIDEMKPDALIIDESHRFKNPESQRTKAALIISDDVHKHGGLVICMTGTPITKTVEDLYSQMKIVDKNVFNFTFSEYKRKYCEVAPTGCGFITKTVGVKNFEDLKKRYQARSHRVMIEDCHDMPEKVITIESVDMVPEQRRHHDELMEQLITELEGNVITTQALTKFQKMAQVTGGYLYNGDKEAIEIKPNPKLEALSDILDQISKEGRKVIIWTYYLPSLKMIKALLVQKNLNFASLSSEDSIQERTRAVDKFALDTKTMIMLSSPAIGGEGIDMSEASYAIYYDGTYRFDLYEQSSRRNYTPNSKKHGKIVYIHLVANNSVDEIMMEAVQKKSDLNRVVTCEKLRKFLKKGK
jgi:superfamily II DNA or RNA helicase